MLHLWTFARNSDPWMSLFAPEVSSEVQIRNPDLFFSVYYQKTDGLDIFVHLPAQACAQVLNEIDYTKINIQGFKLVQKQKTAR